MPVRVVRDVRYQSDKYRLVIPGHRTRDNNQIKTLLRNSGHVGHAGHLSTLSLVNEETHPVVTKTRSRSGGCQTTHNAGYGRCLRSV